MEKLKEQAKAIRESVSLKLVALAVIALLMLIPKGMLKSLIWEREQRRDETVEEIYQKWGNEQSITGPYISIPYLVYKNKEDKDPDVHYAHFLPDELYIEGEMLPESRYRGIFSVITYQSKLELSGKFKTIEFSDWSIPDENILWDKSELNIGISDLRGVRNNIFLQVNDKEIPSTPGVSNPLITKSGISFPLNDIRDSLLNFRVHLLLNGSENLSFVPVGSTTRVHLESSWDSPSFNGNFLPYDRKIDKDGFVADWKIFELNRNFPRKWLGHRNVQTASFGVELIKPVDHYQKSTRSVKYAILFVVLTFLVFFFAEIFSKKRVHPIQYLLAGIALIVFFSLLMALSEHMDFNLAYLISSVAVVGLIAYFSHALFKKRKITFSVTGLLSVLYIFLFTVLQLADYSLLIGNIGLFIVIAGVMYAATRVNWYGKT
jgi:inner membrane protein